jgi:hypothetical protein
MMIFSVYSMFPTPDVDFEPDEEEIDNADGTESNHGDIGGTGKQNPALDWMIERARDHGVKFPKRRDDG